MDKIVTTALDVLGLLLVAAGVVAALFPLIGWAGLAVAGVLVLAGSQLAEHMRRPRRRKADGEFS